ncbi:ankyrin repeat and sterile alpha motif domain-containing protein 1B isoform X2 [Eurosta solidaginis]|uniref:ankyrin repeat and sterile alpha motif domain-containing protein 1B isoform X2 n=1 Tax=Eurosta solidaginis TaxID=178769 RepID=UPI003531455F
MGKDHDLLEAARIGNIAVVGKILEQISKRSSGPFASFRRSPCINSQDVNGYTPLHHACLNGHGNIVRLLLAHNAAPDMPDIRGSTPLYLAAWAGHDEIVKQLLLHTPKAANPNAQTIDNETPLHCAAQHGHNTVLAILLAYGADPTVRNNSFQTALDLAAQFGRLQAVQTLIRTHPELLAPYRTTGSNTHSTPTAESTPYTISPSTHIFTHTCLHLASRNGHKKVVEALLAAGVDVNVMTNSGTALHEAALCGKKAVVNVLLQAGINPNATDGLARTALDLLKDYPPHVTYEISCAIKDFYKDASNGTHFKPINEHSDQDDYDRSDISISPVPNMNYFNRSENNAKVSAIAQKEFLMPKTLKQNGLSVSMGSLEQTPKPQSNYLQMKPIFWQNSHTCLSRLQYVDATSIFTSANKQRSLQTVFGEIQRTRSPSSPSRYGRCARIQITSKMDKHTMDTTTGSMNDLHGLTSISTKCCVDEYVKMTVPMTITNSTSGDETLNSIEFQSFHSIRSNAEDHREITGSNNLLNSPTSSNILKHKKPLPSPRSIKTNDYPNIKNILTPSNTSIISTNETKKTLVTSSMSQQNQSPHLQSSIGASPPKDANNNSQVIKHTKHSPTPDFPPPSVTQAEHTILEFIRPKSEQETPRQSLNLKQESNTDLEAFIVDAINQFELPDSPESSRASDCVEEFVGDVPFAGLFKGSNLNLTMENREETPALSYISNRLRSPSLVRSIKPLPPPRRNILLQQNKPSDYEDFNASKVWQEIDTIFENIGHEVNEVDESMKKQERVNAVTDIGKRKSESSLQIRRPADLCLGNNEECTTTNWCHSPNTLIFGQIHYMVYYLGSTVIRELHGTASTRKSILKFKRNATPLPIVKERESNLLKDCNHLTKMLKKSNQDTHLMVGLAVSYAGVKFLHAEDSSIICTHDIENINCVCQDSEDLRYFAYITKEDEMHYCHVFMVDNVELSQEIILTLAEAFEVAYQLVLSKDDGVRKSEVSNSMENIAAI